jgi:hypothetical protein
MGWRLSKEPTGSASDPIVAQYVVAVLNVVVPKLSATARTDVEILWRIWHPVEETNWATKIHLTSRNSLQTVELLRRVGSQYQVLECKT